MVERFGTPEQAIRALAHVGADPPPDNHLDAHLAENIRVGRQRIDALMAEPRDTACKPSKR
jgi:hypothetical protein